jgi:outer membrane murein-binding lipoprotein Lpp
MESIPIITESVQYGVIGICIMLIIANAYAMVAIVKTFVGAIMKLYEKIDALNTNISDLNTKIEMLTIRTKMVKRSAGQQSGIINP